MQSETTENFGVLVRCLVLLALLTVSLFARAGPVVLDGPAKPDLFKPIVSLTNFGLYESSPFFSGDEKAWLETSLRFGWRFEYKCFAFEAVGIGVRPSGRDPYGSGNTPQFGFDTLYLQWNQTSGLPFKLTIGRQPISSKLSACQPTRGAGPQSAGVAR